MCGQLRLVLDGKALTLHASSKAQALLAYLAVEAGREHPRERLAGLFWPELPEKRARQNLSQTLYVIRQELGETEGREYYLNLTQYSVKFNTQSDYWLDRKELLRLVEECERHPHPHKLTCQECLERLEQAVAIYRGSFLADFSLKDTIEFEEWCTFTRERLQRKALQALGMLVECLEGQGQIEASLEHAWRHVELDPLGEAGHRQVMRLLAASGRRNEALAQFNALQRLLHDSLGVAPDVETHQLYERILKQAPQPGERPSHAVRLPGSLSPFIGRQAELGELGGLLRNPFCRLVTVCGPGGVGKTRLALEVAHRLAPDFPDGVAFISLSAHQPGSPLWPLLAEALRFSVTEKRDPEGQLFDYLREKQALLLFDSFETALEQGVWLAHLLRSAPQLTALVTSRARLNLKAEHIFPLAGMRYPQGDELPEAHKYSALQLFASGVERTLPGFKLDEAVLPQAARICQLVGGMPLGVLLASAWVDTYSLEEIEAHIRRSLDFLSVEWQDIPERQRSLRATFDYSWNQLMEAEQRLLTALGVFHGNFSLQAAGEVTQAPLRTLQSLVDKSLVNRLPDGRYRLHDLLLQYAGEKLGEIGSLQNEVRERHSAYYLERMAGWERELKGPRQRQVLEEIDWQLADVQAGWLWAAGQVQVGLLKGALEGLGTYYELRRRYAEGKAAFHFALDGLAGCTEPGGISLRGWLQAWLACFCRLLGEVEQARELRGASRAALERAEAAGEDTRWGQALLAYEQGDTAGSLTEQVEWLQRSSALYQALDDAWRQADVLTWAGELAHRLGNPTLGMKFLQEAVELSREVGEPSRLAYALHVLAYQTLILGQWEIGARLMEEAGDYLRAAGDIGQEASASLHLGVSLGWQGLFIEAIEYIERALPLLRQVGNRFSMVYGTLGLGVAQMHLGQSEQAEQALQAALGAAQRDDFIREVAASLTFLGCLALARGQPARAQAALQESVASYRLQSAAGELGMALGGLALAELRLGHREAAQEALGEARTSLLEALRIAVATHSHFTTFTCWAACVALLAESERWEQVLQVHAAGQGVPLLASSVWQAEMVAPWVVAAEANLSVEAAQAAREKGQGRDLFTIYAEVLEEGKAGTAEGYTL